MELTSEQLTDIMLKLTGPIVPVGETREDERRFTNLKLLCDVVNKAVIIIDNVGYLNKDRVEYSMKEAGKYAANFLTKTLGIGD